jgi:hypothetical protein
LEIKTHKMITQKDSHQMVEIQHNLESGEIDEALALLRQDCLLALRTDCLESIERQRNIVWRINCLLNDTDHEIF